jgi:hypothetical protein
MNRRNILLVAVGLTSFCLAATALPGIGIAEDNPLIGTWKLNLEKSKYSPGPAPRSLILNFVADGANLTNTAEVIDAEGKATKTVFAHIYDGKPHPTTGVAGGLYDSSTYTRIDANTVNWIRSKDGKTVQTGSNVLSADGKTFTVTTDGTGLSGQPIHSVAVFERQ